VGAAVEGAAAWGATPAAERAAILRRAADLYEAHMPEFLALAAREAGKTLADGVAEVREAVDFLRYYAAGAAAAERDGDGPLGAVVCVSPWNFPLAIFTGQVAAALAAGNAVLAKPAEQTPLIAARAVELMREAGVPSAALQLLPGDGPGVGGPLCADPRIGGVCFTGSTEVARLIHRALADNAPADAALIAETGGLNAMIVDSTALPEQAVRDIVASAFRSAGQRCSALRMLYVQEEACERLLTMLFGAMDALEIGDPWALDADVGPVIDEQARADIESYIEAQAAAGRVLKRLQAPMRGLFVGPTVIEVEGIAALEREVFGPVLHVARFRARDLDRVIDAVNASGYGLTFGLHSRIDARVRRVAERLHVGNVYVNRNQIGAVVGSQPFGGEGLSGTGPKAGGPFYLRRLRRAPSQETPEAEDAQQIDATAAQAGLATLAARGSAERPDIRKALAAALAGAEGPVAEALAALDRFDPGPFEMPGPTGESNRLTLHPRGTALCLGPDARTALAQAVLALGTGCGALMIAPGAPEAAAALRAAGAPVAALDGAMAPEALATLQGFALVADAGGPERGRALRRALAARDGPILPLVRDLRSPERFVVERHLCVDTTAAGGNAALLANS
ncbi:L-glutamate gamma-semialdehyde dehydrogenase, partial [Rubrimonas sp.]|uniref:L-glutamate gamma-semialdehyde dehydrogenase n=1 Tax=Rubrimonas sp. TaxID=2036015 RepID=UPI002FDE062D